jgi:hypothetical protein
MKAADLIITQGRIICMDGSAHRPSALAIAGNRIVAIGADDDVAGLCGPHTRMIDARGKSVIPGIIESHLHLFGGAVELDSHMINEINGFRAVSDSISHYAKSQPQGAVIVVNGAAHTSFGDRPITRQAMDEIVPDRPFIMICFDHHTVWANTRALEAAGLMRGAPLPPGNEVVLDASGLATGELREAAAFNPVLALTPTGGREWLGMTTGENPVPPATPAQRATDLAFMKKGLDYAASLGITTLHNMDGNWYQLELLDALRRAGDLIARVEVPFHQKNYFETARVDEAVEMRARYNDDMLWCRRVKIFMDGVLESMTALMLDDYPGAPGNCGAPLFTARQFNEIATRIDAHKMQISVHAIGDGGVRRTLDGYEAARRANGARDSRHRIEHIEVIDPADVPRLAELGVVASLQPIVGLGVPGNALEPCLTRLGRKLPMAYAWNTLRQAGAKVAFSSDWPVSPLSPFLGMQAAMTQRPVTPDCPPQAQTLMEALHGFTVGGAWCDFSADRKGRLAPGYLADVVVLDADLEATPAPEMGGVKPVLTVCDGRVSFSAEG